MAAGDGGGFEREHGAEGELAVFSVRAELVGGHGHDPVGGEELVGAARAALLGVGEEGGAVEHEGPAAILAMIMATGVEAGSMLVPEVVWASSASMRVVGGFGHVHAHVHFGGLGFFHAGHVGHRASLRLRKRRECKERCCREQRCKWEATHGCPCLDGCVRHCSAESRCETQGSGRDQIRRAMRRGRGGGDLESD